MIPQGAYTIVKQDESKQRSEKKKISLFLYNTMSDIKHKEICAKHNDLGATVS